MEGVRHEEERQERLSRAQRLETRSHHCSENQTPRLVARRAESRHAPTTVGEPRDRE